MNTLIYITACNMEIKQFTEMEAELVSLAKGYEGITINGVDDKEGYKLADEARKDLKAKRVEIKKIGKHLRDDAIKFQKSVIAKEKELVALVEPLEKSLKDQQDDIKMQKLRLSNEEKLPARSSELAKYTDDTEFDLLGLTDSEFESLLAEKREVYLAKKEAELIDREQKAKRAQELEEAKKQAVRDKEERDEREKELAKLKKAEQKRELAKKEDFVRFLAENGYTQEDKGEFYIKDDGETVTLYRKVAVYEK